MSTSAAPASPPAVPPADRTARPTWRQLLSFDNRFLAPILITCILLLGHYQYGNLDSHTSELLTALTGGLITTYSPTFVAIVATILTELVLGRLLAGRWPMLASAYISGISVGILVKSPELAPYLFCAVASIASKYVFRVAGRHLWNPTNFGITLTLFLAGMGVFSMSSLSVQTGNALWPVVVIWVLGALILGRLGRLHIPLAFAAAYIPLALLRAAINFDSDVPGLTFLNVFEGEVAPLTSAMYQLFICFMITDPKTTTRSKWSQCLVAVLVAVAESVLRLCRDPHAPYHALFIVGPIANLVEIAFDARRKRTLAAAA